MSLTDLIKNVKKWSMDRGLDKASPIKQMQKLSEEWGELNAGEAKSNQGQGDYQQNQGNFGNKSQQGSFFEGNTTNPAPGYTNDNRPFGRSSNPLDISDDDLPF